ncbi:hypothetical protein HQ487_04465, partial [Candidatus Uhrbacteria bacterium]|nr:hypothetical protein [Candidatus Uhrbacteria bacterium]
MSLKTKRRINGGFLTFFVMPMVLFGIFYTSQLVHADAIAPIVVAEA